MFPKLMTLALKSPAEMGEIGAIRIGRYFLPIPLKQDRSFLYVFAKFFTLLRQMP
jgi:hypothetical protein